MDKQVYIVDDVEWMRELLAQYLSLQPGLSVCGMAASAEEAEWAMGHAIKRFAEQREKGEHPDSVLFFCGRENFPETLKPSGEEYQWGKAMVLADTTADHDNLRPW